MSRTLSVALLLVLGACTFGPRVENVALARQPRGASVTLVTSTQTIRGELLEVQDSALLVVADLRITLVPYHAIRRGEAELVPHLTGDGRVPSSYHIERLRRVSRFPQGLTPELRRALLDAYDQSEPEAIR